MKAKELPLLEYLSECFELSESSPSGLLWKVRPRKHFPTSRGWNICNRKCAGKPAGTLKTDKRNGKQYWIVNILGVLYKIHRIVYSMHNKTELSIDLQVDHIDNNGLNNRPSNLRHATHGENRQNTKRQKNNSSGHKGVVWHKSSNAWLGQINFKGIHYYLGTSSSKEVMVKIVREFREKLHKEFKNHG